MISFSYKGLNFVVCSVILFLQLNDANFDTKMMFQYFDELWHSGVSASLISEVKQHLAMLVHGYVSTLMGDHLGALLISLMTLQLALVDRNPFWSCLLQAPSTIRVY